jgi:hypothetical protein
MANQGLFAALLLSLVIAAPVFGQAPPPVAPSWTGWAQCQITIQAPGYSHRETHLWTMTGAGTTNANMEIYPASWTVTGDGSLQRVNGPTTVSAQWSVNGTLQTVTIGTTRHLDRMTVQRWTNHGPARSGLTGTEISTTNSVPRSRAVVLDVQQWAFPAIETGTASARATGSSSLPFDGLRGPMNPPSGASGVAACSWDFARGGVSPSAPPPSGAVVSLVYPNGGEKIGAGDGAVNRLVRFRYGSAAAQQRFDLDLSTDAGGTWTSLRRGDQPSLIDGVFLLQLPLPRTSTSRAMVRVTPTGRPEAADVSDAPFTIVQHSIRVTTPVAPMVVGQRATISWTHDFPAAERRFRIRLARPNLSGSESIVWLGEVDGTGSSESFTFTVPGPAITQAQLAIITPDEVFAAFSPLFDTTNPSSSSSPSGGPRIVSVTPATIELGSGCNNEITLTGDGTHWGFGSVLDMGPGVRVAIIAPQSPTRIVAFVIADYSAAPGPRSITVRAGDEVVTLPNAVTVVAREQPTVTVTPSSAPADGGFITVTLTGRGTRWEQGVTQLFVDTLTPNNTVRLEEFAVTSPTSLTLRLYVYLGGAGGANGIRIYNRRASSLPGACEIMTLPTAFTVTSAGSQAPPPGGALPSITAVTPAAAPPGARAFAVSITATGTHFLQGVTYVDFGELAGATSLTITSPTTANATINVDPAAPLGPRTVTMTTPSPDGTSEIVSRAAAFTIGSSQPPGGAPPPGGTSPSSGMTPASGRYRVTATSVYFRNAEADNPGPAIGDGKGDEIYLTSYAQRYDRRNGNQLSAGPLLRTPVHGDLSGAGGGTRVRAGSATPNGGIATGDEVQLQMPGASPVWLWEGELRDGIDVVVLRPVLWEFDGNEAAWYTVYAQRFPPTAPRQVFDLPVVQAAIPRAGVAFESVPGFTMTGAWVADTQDHPVGTVLNVTGTGQVAGTWTDRVLTLTREKLEPWLTAAGGAGRVEMRVWGEIHVGAPVPGETQTVRREAVADYTLNVIIERRP